MASLFPNPHIQFIDANGNPLAGGKLYTYQAGSVVPQDTYTDYGGGTPNSNPVILDNRGSASIWLGTSAYYMELRTSTGVLVWSADNVNRPDGATINSVLGSLSASGGSALVGFIQAGNGSIARILQAKAREIVSVLDVGIVPNDASAAAANLTAIRKVVATSANGGDVAFQYTGTVLFPPGASKDTYYFAGIIPCRDGIRIDLGGNVALFTKAESTAEDAAGFFYARRDFVLENGYIEVDYTATVANRGNAIKLNARGPDSDQGAGQYFLNNYEESQQPGGTVMTWMPGNIVLRNLRIKSNNPTAAVIQMFGGLKNVVLENIEIDGQSLSSNAIDYEFGDATAETPATVLAGTARSSHGCDFLFRNIEVRGYAAAGQDGTAVGIRGAYNVTIDGLYCKDVKNVLAFSPGEAMNYNPGSYDALGVKRGNYLRNIVGQGVTVNGISIQGTYTGGGFLAPVMAAQTFANAEPQSTDLIDAIVENFVLSGTTNGFGCTLSGGKIILRNGRITGFNSAVFDGGTRNLLVERVAMLDSTGNGMRVNDSATVYASGWTNRRTVVRGCEIAGNSIYGIIFEKGSSYAIVEGNNFGYDNRATGQFTWAGIAGNSLTSLKVNGVEILTGPGTPVPWNTSDAQTTQDILTAINSYTVTSGYSATFKGNTILIRATAGTGTAPNGFVVLPAGTMTFSGKKDMSGGKYELTQQSSVNVQADLTAVSNRKQIVVRNNNTLAALGNAYVNQDTYAIDCVFQENRGTISTSGPWVVDGMAQDTSTNLADKTKPINTVNKYTYKRCYNTSTTKLFVAQGTAVTSTWISVDGGTTITPV